MVSSWGQVITASLQNIWWSIASFIPDFLAAVIIFIVGWIIAVILGKLVAQVIRMTRIDSALKAARVDQVIEKAGFHLDAGLFIGTLVKWFFIVVSLVAALDVLGLNSVTIFLQNVLDYLPSVIMAALIIMVAAVVAEVMEKLVVGSAKAAEIKSANLAGAITKWAIWIFAILTALYQLGIATYFVSTLFTGVIIAASLALGLAFGLGGQDAAAKYIEKVKNDVTDR